MPIFVNMNSLCRLSLLTLSLYVALPSLPQGQRPWERFFYEVAAYEDNAAAMDEDAYETLCDMEDHPLNINTASREELEQLPFLTATQIEDISEYIYRHGPMLTLGELQLIKSLDYARRRLLSCFVVAGEPQKKRRPPLKTILAKGRNEIMLTVRQPLYKRKGDRNGYLGYNTKHSLRYTFDAGDNLRFGLVGAQDSGEPFFTGKNGMGYDHYSFFVQMRNVGALQNLVVGHYRVQFGMGLVANTGFSLGKTAMLTTLGRTTSNIRASLSRSAADYLQGVAATVKITKRVKISAFASFRPIDATLNNGDGTIRTIVTTGYHRTPNEMAKKNNRSAATGGLNLRYANGGFHVGATAIYSHFDRDLKPNTTAKYRQYYPAGNDFVNIGANYGYTSHAVSASGETAIDRSGAVATINTVSVNIVEGLSAMFLHRYYSYKYTSLYANSFSDGGHVSNEHGFYLGMAWQPTANAKLNAYADYAHSPWPRYRVSRSADSFDAMLSATLSLKRWTLSGRYRLRMRYRDNDEKTAAVRYSTHRARLSATCDYGKGWSSTTQADFALTDFDGSDRGYMLSQNVNVQWRWLKATVSANYFHTDSYESRLYAYERGPLHTFSFPSYYGHGLRYAFMLRADIGKRLMAIAKIGVTDYFDRSTIGSGLQTIDGSAMADVDVQLRWRF